MESSDERERATEAAETAAEWFVRLRDEQLTEPTRREYVRWLRASPQNVAEMLRVCRLHGQLRWSKLMAELAGRDVLSNIVRRYPPPGAPLRRHLRALLLPRRSRLRIATVLIVIVLIVALGLVFQHSML